jgi:2-dehydropantoate 2-reductase
MGIHRDIKVRKRRTEVDYQIGAVVARGKALDVPVPVNERIVDLIHQIEQGKRGQDWKTITELSVAAGETGAGALHR